MDNNKLPYTVECPSCNKTIRYMRYSGMADLMPHFYCNRCSNILLRECDRKLLDENNPSEGLLEQIASTLPCCPCGGRFAPGSNPKCPYCNVGFPHDHNPITRLTDPYVIKLEGAELIREV